MDIKIWFKCDEIVVIIKVNCMYLTLILSALFFQTNPTMGGGQGRTQGGAYAPPGHSRDCWCTPWRSEPIEIRNSFQYNLIEIKDV